VVKTQMVAAAAENPILPSLPEMVVGLVAFLLLLFVLQKYAVPRFEKLYAERSERGIARSEEAQAEAQRTLAQYRSQLAQARSEAARIRDDARAEGQQILDEMRAQAQAEAERIVSHGQARLAAERIQLVTELRADVGRQAVTLASRVVGEALEDDARARGTVERFLTDLEGAAAPESARS
jgi:F-type H+-transporting ATPase subunit b